MFPWKGRAMIQNPGAGWAFYGFDSCNGNEVIVELTTISKREKTANIPVQDTTVYTFQALCYASLFRVVKFKVWTTKTPRVRTRSTEASRPVTPLAHIHGRVREAPCGVVIWRHLANGLACVL